MNRWAIQAPHAQVHFSHPDTDVYMAFCDELRKVPGIKDKNGFWVVPQNALKVAMAIANQFNIQCPSAEWLLAPKPVPSWSEVEAELRIQGILKDFVLDGFLTDYQKEAICFGWNRLGVSFWHSTGAGKTLSGIATTLSQPGGVIVVTRAASRIQYAREIERFLNTRAFVVRPESGMPVRVKGKTYREFLAVHQGEKGVRQLWADAKATHGVDKPKSVKEYLDECKQDGIKPFIVVGWESLTDNLPMLRSCGATNVIFDESHKGKGSKRYDIIHLPDLPADPQAAAAQRAAEERDIKTKNGFIKETDEGRKGFVPVENMAASAAELARCVKKRIGTSATPVKDRLRDLWSQLDLVEPNAHGSSSGWRSRYCDMKPGQYGGMDDRGTSNMEELQVRTLSLAHILEYKDTHRHLPPKRRQSMYLTPEDQCSELGGFAKEMADAKKRGATAVLEVKLAMAASRKRKAVVDLIGDHVSSKQKVVVFTGRRKDCEDLGSLVGKAFKDVKVWASHGGHSTDQRQVYVDDYMAHPGPCVLVGTGDAFGEALNLDTTDAALFVMLPYTPGQVRQWEGRFHRASTKKSVIIYYVIAEGTVDEHIADILISKLPAVEQIAKDSELAAAEDVLAGFDPKQTDEEFASSVLSFLDS